MTNCLAKSFHVLTSKLYFSKFDSNPFKKMALTPDIVQILSLPHVHIKDRNKVYDKIKLLIKDGYKSLQIVSDYDQTLTKQHENGKKHLSSFGLLRVCPSVPKWYLDKEQEICDKYRPIEFDPFLSYEEKLKHMEDWWNTSIALLRGIQITQQEIDEAVKNYEQVLRTGTNEIFSDLSSFQVPVLVFSAGLGDTVDAVLKHHNVLHPNVKVISNFLKFDDKRTILSYKDNIIHVLNKNEQMIKGTEYYDLVKNRENVIVMGDHLGDARMAEGVPHNVVLKIGFLYENVDVLLPDYMNAFDIVLVDDQTMDVLKTILKPILQN